jgi:7-alpha-hydroxysteroid dehydrogenase
VILDRFRLDGKVAIVTGAGKGIGAGTARALAEAGADVACAARTTADIEEVADDVRSLGRRALAIPTDVTQSDQRLRLVTTTVQELGRIDVLVNNAGGWNPRPLMETSEKALEAAFQFNVTSAFSLTKLAVPHLQENGTGSVVNISSRAASMVQP